MVKGQKATLTARTKEERKRVRKDMGTLKSLTVQPSTKTRYQDALQLFFKFLQRENLELPRKRDNLDPLVSDYLEFLWSEGEGRSMGQNVLAALQDFDPKLRGHLQGSWRLMRTWNANEVPNRAPPLTEKVLQAMVGWSWFNKHWQFGISLLVAFYGLLRTGELLNLQAWQIQMAGPLQPAVLNLGLTKSGKRQGAEESVTISEITVLKFLWAWKSKAPNHQFLTSKPHQWRSLFQECLRGVGLEEWGFRPYSLRRGGATAFFTRYGSLDRVLLLGRWTAAKTARIYLNSGLAMLAELKIPNRQLQPYVTIFYNTSPVAPKLEPGPLKRSRTGGRGSKRKSASSRKNGRGELPF